MKALSLSSCGGKRCEYEQDERFDLPKLHLSKGNSSNSLQQQPSAAAFSREYSTDLRGLDLAQQGTRAGAAAARRRRRRISILGEVELVQLQLPAVVFETRPTAAILLTVPLLLLLLLLLLCGRGRSRNVFVSS